MAWKGLEALPGVRNRNPSRRSLERATAGGESPVGERGRLPAMILSTTGHGEPCGKQGGPPSKAKHSWRPIVNEYREGKVKRTPGGE
jgi:hypothetical protein